MTFDIWTLLWLFLLGSFFGWLAEIFYTAIVHRKFINPGILNGPYCPQYGLMLIVPYILLLGFDAEHQFLPTLLCCLASSFLTELVFNWFLNHTTKIKVRDYSTFKWNIHGYVCVPLALVRGLCFTLILLFVFPVLSFLLSYMNRFVGWIILAAIGAIFLFDMIISAITLSKLKHQFKRLSELAVRIREARDALASTVSESAIGTAERVEDLKLQEKLQEAVSNAEENYTALLNKSNFLKRRFLNASPHMSSAEYKEELANYRITTEEWKKRHAEITARNLYEYEGTFENPEDRPFAFGMNLTKLFWIFFIGCIAGFVLEELWAFFLMHAVELRVGLVYGPLQPIYGGGAALITLCLYKLYKQNGFIIFVASGIIGAAFEYFCSLGQEMLFGTVSWDYSDTPFNLDGRTNLMFGIIWGFLGLIWIKFIYPAMSRWIEKIPKRIGGILTILLAAFLIFDAFMSCAALVRADERSRNVPATTSFQVFLDEHLDDQYLAIVYPNMRRINEDGTLDERLKHKFPS